MQSTAIYTIYLTRPRRLQPNDLILTFNYDVLLERALERIGKPFRLFPNRYTAVRDYYGEVDSERQEVILLKVHGSIDWFDRRRFLERIAARERSGLSAPPDDPIFGRTDVHTETLVDGPRFPNDPLREMHRVREVELVYQKLPLFVAAPWLLTPSSIKVIYAIKDFWHGLGGAGALNLGMAIIGFSLPQHDEYARQVLCRMVRNYQRVYWDESILGLRKSPLVLVDHRPDGASRDEYCKRYRFVDWDKATCCFEGFSEGTLPHIFAEI